MGTVGKESIMKWQLVTLAIVLLGIKQGGSLKSSARQDQIVTQGPVIKCTVDTSDVRWHLKGKRPTVSIRIEASEGVNISAMPSLYLMSLPKKEGVTEDEYWAPFSITVGTDPHQWQKIDISAGKPILAQVDPIGLRWALTKSSASIWPIQKFATAVPPGRYSLQVRLEVDGGKMVSSNELEISVVR
jgi:hypothetical protein